MSLGGVDAPSADGSEDLEELWQGGSRPFRLQRQLSLPNLLFEGQGRVGPRLAQPPPLCIPPDRPDFSGHQASQGTETQGSIVAPLWENQPWLSELSQLLTAAPWPVPLRRDLLSRRTEQYGTLDPSCGLSTCGRSTEPTSLPERVLKTISEARAPSTRCLYALKWSVSPLGV